MTRLAAILALSAEDRRLLALALATNVAARLALQVRSMEGLRRWASPPPRRRAMPGAPGQDRIAWAGRAAARRTPFSTCLSSALALQRLLALHGHASELHIGVAGSAARFSAHAWLECDGEILIGEEERDGYTRLTGWTGGAPPPEAT